MSCWCSVLKLKLLAQNFLWKVETTDEMRAVDIASWPKLFDWIRGWWWWWCSGNLDPCFSGPLFHFLEKKKTSSMASLWLGERSEPKFSCFLPGNKVISIFRQEEIYNNTLTNMEWIFTSISIKRWYVFLSNVFKEAYISMPVACQSPSPRTRKLKVEVKMICCIKGSFANSTTFSFLG